MGFLPKGTEWIIILIIVLVIFGPKNLPKLGASLGKTVKNLREGMEGDDAPKGSDEAPAEEESEEDAKIRELEAQLAEAKKKKEEQDAE
ncbi:twin-arginine translocase TatA/TatE family subunit [Collinsella intestinalis]|uniref:twin-arginine translocase TatA/TatE family subunit n=1 Tax=Collinsella intestinalis TaxID=147207 RepID=UPI00195720C3|nr:twin-arginine translocase TatA/TatE family subunit [Collinsella intestinalis]MBM6683908.1 twin-arginine translocase TatA/TatE family subunit [Collinsella intestinalis]